MDEDILRQILEEVRETNQFNRKAFRFYTIFLVVMLLIAILAPFLMNSGLLTHHKNELSTKAERLLNQGRPREVISLAEKYIKQKPLNPYGPWYLARAQYQLGNFQKALHWLDKTEDLEPRWENDCIQPYREVIEKRLSKARKAEEDE